MIRVSKYKNNKLLYIYKDFIGLVLFCFEYTYQHNDIK